MLIRSPCHLGEQFENHRGWGYPGRMYLSGVDFFLWTCGMEGVTLHGDHAIEPTGRERYNVAFFRPDDTNDITISFEVPDRFFSEQGVPLRELGIDREKNGRVSGIRMKGEKDWFYRIGLAPHYGGEALEVRTPQLDAMFRSLLPAVAVDLLEFL